MNSVYLGVGGNTKYYSHFTHSFFSAAVKKTAPTRSTSSIK